jgi:hypothetical protein
MVSKKSKNQKGSLNRGLKNSVRKLSNDEIKLFVAVLTALMQEVPCPRDARKSYLKEVENRLRNNGVSFLAQTRAFPTYGLKLLGRDLNGFPIPGLKKAEGKVYPKLFAWYWAELERLSKISAPSKADAKRAQRVLVVLSFAKMIKISSVNQIKQSLLDFETRVVKPQSEESDRGNEQGSAKAKPEDAGDGDNKPPPPEGQSRPDGGGRPSLVPRLFNPVILDSLPRYVDFDSISTKPSAIRDNPIMLPEWFGGHFMRITRDASGTKIVLPSALKPPPYGKVHVLTEAGGKLRLIVPYNTPFVHSTGLFARATTVLKKLPGDCSTDQSKGHRYIKKLTAMNNSGSGEVIVSADLDAFSDNTKTSYLRQGLVELGLPELDDYLFNLPITLPNGKVITPKKVLMGLKGTFELNSYLHHCAVSQVGIKSYSLCGDDLVFKASSIEPYRDIAAAYGWTINERKTVVSPTAAVFCGEMYWHGMRVSPRIPKVHTIYSNSKLRGATVIFSCVRSSVKELNSIYNRRAVSRIMRPILHILYRVWSGVVPQSLPSKLRGLGMKPARPIKLLDLLENKAVLHTALMSIGVKREQVSTNRWFGLPIQITPSSIQQELPDFPSLLSKGAISLRPTEQRPALRKDVTLLDLYQVLEWYYDGTRLEPSEFGH